MEQLQNDNIIEFHDIMAVYTLIASYNVYLSELSHSAPMCIVCILLFNEIIINSNS